MAMAKKRGQIAEAAAQLLRDGPRPLANLFQELYDAIPTAFAEVRREGGPVDWCLVRAELFHLYKPQPREKPHTWNVRLAPPQRKRAARGYDAPCAHFARGACNFGERCRFAHSGSERSATAGSLAVRPCGRDDGHASSQQGKDSVQRSYSIKLTGLPADATRDHVQRLCATTPFAHAVKGLAVRRQSKKDAIAVIDMSDASVARRLVAVLDGRRLHGRAVRAAMQPGGWAYSRPADVHAAPAATTASEDVRKFWSRMTAAVEGGLKKIDDLRLHEPNNQQLWFACWSAAAAGAEGGNLKVLLIVMMMAPAGSNFVPPAHDVVHVLSRVVLQPPMAKDADGEISVLELVHDVLSKRLLGNEGHAEQPEAALGHLDALLTGFLSRVQKIIRPDTLMRTGPLMGRFAQTGANYEQALRRVMRSRAAMCAEPEPNAQPWEGWLRMPTVGWLMSPGWLQPPGLSSQYKDVAEFCETLERLTTLLTFYWGAGAISPRCRHQQPGSEATDAKRCGEPLLTACAAGRPCTALLPGGGQCNAPAVLGCPRSFHAQQLCQSCLRRGQMSLMGNPMQQKAPCSTDIYDAQVEREQIRRDGHVYVLSQLRSRRPPEIEPNWHTTYRLNCASLVAVGRLSCSCEQLQPTSRICWAEVVPVLVAQGADESQSRKSGRIALRPLGRSDVRAFPPAADFEVGTRVFIIDLRVFVPEVIPVLATYADPTLAEQLGRIAFVDRLIGIGTPLRPNIEGADDVTQRVMQAIMQSEIEVLQRMNVGTRDRLISQIEELAKRANLYGTQLDAFCQGLQYAVHCTQGPPGTGKSYTGVQLIAAFDIIRREAIREGRAVGPIVVLAYKNHALDEILLDLLDLPFLGVRGAGSLIRCGKPDDLSLKQFTERTTSSDIAWERQLNERLSALRAVRDLGNDLRDLIAHLHAHITSAPQLSFGDLHRTLTCWRSSKAVGVGPIQLTSALIMLMGLLGDARASQDAQDEEEAENVEIAVERPWSLVRSSLEAYQRLNAALTAAAGSAFDDVAALACIRDLTEGAVHWANPIESIQGTEAASRTATLLEAWLSGVNPPPRCMSAEEDAVGPQNDEGAPNFLCLNVACNPSPYCSALHMCVHESGCRQRRSRTLAGCDCCELHRCQARGDRLCLAASLGGSRFCADHSCSACVHMHQHTGADIEQAFGQACEQHTCTIRNCANIMYGPGVAYCQRHSCGECLRTGPDSVLPAMPNSSLCKDHKCMADGCAHLRDSAADVPQQYCRYHACYRCVGIRQVVDPQLPESGLCADHRCQFKPPAAQESVLCKCLSFGNSRLCEWHSCRVCLGLACKGCVAWEHIQPAITEYPRNVCLLHRLCSAIGPNGAMCENLADGEQHFCAEHRRSTGQKRALQESNQALVAQTCHGITKKGRPCKTKGEDAQGVKFYCDAHADQASSSEEEVDSEEQGCDLTDGEDAEPIPPVVKLINWLTAGSLFSGSTFAPTLDEAIPHLPVEGVAEPMLVDRPAGPEAPKTVAEPMLVDRPAGPEAPNPQLAQAPSATLAKTCSRVLETEQQVAQVLRDAIKPDSWERGLWRSRVENVSSLSELANLLKIFEAALPPWVLGKLWAATARNDWVRSLERLCRCEGSSNSLVDPHDELNSLLDALIVCLEPIASLEPGQDTCGEAAMMPPSVYGHPAEAAEEQCAEQEVTIDDSLAIGILDPDELEYNEAEYEGEQAEVNEEQHRLHEVLGENAASEVDSEAASDDEIEVARPPGKLTATDFDRLVTSVQRWSWKMPLEQRWLALASCLERMGDIVTVLRTLAEPQVDEARRNRAEASAASFKKARIIGATVVGAARRLEALRAAEPFAVVVEEACEVMEPTLMAVLSVPSLCKLELVGDHRQLPAFVQQCWFNLETTIPSLKVSLFERLVTGGQAEEGVVTCTVLDEQRRMRPAIAALTSGHYADLVDIKCHSWTRTQRVGDKVIAKVPKSRGSALRAERELWHAKGMLVPGIVAQQFFWNLVGNRQGKPMAGLSACNYVEAEAVANFVKYLTGPCSIPPASISVITPYKGQKMAIIKALRTIVPSAVPRPAFTQQGKGGKGNVRSTVDSESAVLVSTVDRYQGDENDIVLLSLVRTRPGNRFVALKNRFIVAASRARMGFYIFGSSEAIAQSASGRRGPEHWVGLLNQLSADGYATGGNAGSAFMAECQPCEATSGVGICIPICCPRHPEMRLEVQCGCTDSKCMKVHFPRGSTSCWNTFCAKRCSKKLEWCGHFCSVPCHSPVTQPHTLAEQCPESMVRPCEDHPDVPLHCGALFQSSSTRNLSLADALSPESFRCEIEMEYRLPGCPHRVTLKCFEYRQLLVGELQLPPCKETVDDWHHPTCNHVFKSPQCFWRREAEANPPDCMEMITIVKPCGCRAKIPCHERAAESSAAKCLVSVNMERPRCTHMLSLKCFERTALWNLWLREAGERAQRLHVNEPRSVEVLFDEAYGRSETVLSSLLPDIKSKVPECSVHVKYVLPCGHCIQEVPCAIAFRWADPADSAAPPLCKELVTLHSKLCGHVVRAECWVTTSEEWNAFPRLCDPVVDGGALPEGQLDSMPKLPPVIARIVVAWCPQRAEVRRHCEHITEVACSHILSRRLPKCRELVPRRLDLCGHDVFVACHQKTKDRLECHAVVDTPFTFSCGRHIKLPGTCRKLRMLQELNPPCDELIACSRFRCGHKVSLPCRLEVLATADTSHAGKRLEGEEVKAGEEYCTVADELPACDTLVLFRSECGHGRTNIPCDLAFKWAAASAMVPPCETLVDIDNPLCGHALRVRCHEAEHLAQLDLWGHLRDGEEPWCELATVGFDETGEPIKRLLVAHDAPRPNLGQVCQSDVQLLGSGGCGCLILRECGHTEQVSCINVHRALDVGRCNELVCIACSECMHDTCVPCHRERSIRACEVMHKCEQKLNKLCRTCNVNELSVPCFKLDVHCDAQVSASLACGHEVTWMCGKEADPRDRSHLCAECLLPAWKLVLNEPSPVLDFEQLRVHAVANLDARFFQLERDLADTSLVKGWRERLIQVQRNIVNIHCDLLQGCIDNGELWEERADPPNLSKTSSFEAVFWHVEEDANGDEAAIRKAFEPRITPYGMGTAVLPLTLDNLKCRTSSDDLTLRVCVGMAFRFKSLVGAEPFMARSMSKTRAPKNARQGGKAQEREKKMKRAQQLAVERANRLSQAAMRKGFDHVLPCTNSDDDALRVYWQPGAVIPLCVVKLQIHRSCGACGSSRFSPRDGAPADGHDFLCWGCRRDCIICFESFAVGQGIECSSHGDRHFMCRECLQGHATHASHPDAIENFRRRGGVTCPMNGCQATPFTEQELAKHLSKEDFEAFTQAKRMLLEATLIARIKADNDQREAMEAAQGLRLRRKAHVVDKILTLACPRCEQAFVDFEGCLALRCARGGCGCAFCGLCQKVNSC